MPELNLFNGGVNTLKDLHKLALNEAADIVDADIVSGSLASLPHSYHVEDNVHPVFIDYKNRTISVDGKLVKFAKVHDYLFKSDGKSPRYTLGKPLGTNSIEWYEMGIASPSEPVTTELITIADGTVTFQYNYPNEDGALQADTAYVYLIKTDDGSGNIMYQSVRVISDSNHNQSAVDVDFSAVPNIVRIWRLVGNKFYLLKGSDAGGIIRDFHFYAGYSRIPYGRDVRRLYAAIAHCTIEWLGDGTAKVHPGKVFTEPQSNILDFAKGTVSTDTAADGACCVTIHLATRDDTRIAGMKMFDMGWYGPAGDGYKYFVKFTVKYDGYEVIEKSKWFKNTPLVYELSSTVANGIGGDLDLTTPMNKSLAGSFEYALTFENTTGNETTAGPISDIINSFGEAITVNIPKLDEPNADTHLLNLYRRNSGLYGGGTSFLFVKQFNILDTPLTFQDSSLIEGLGKLMPPRTLGAVPEDIMFFTEHKGRLFGATKDFTFINTVYTPSSTSEYPAGTPNYKDYYVVSGLSAPYTYTTGDLKGQTVDNASRIVYRDLGWIVYDDTTVNLDEYFTLRWSNLGNPNAWDSLNFLNHSYSITGLASSANGLIVFSSHKTYVLANTVSDNFTFRAISNSQGCIDFKSIQQWQGSVLCASAEGIIVTNGGTVKLISYAKLGIINMVGHIVSSAVVGEDYFLLLNDSRILRLNMLDSTFTYILAEGVDGLGSIDGRLYGSVNSSREEIVFTSIGELPGVLSTNKTLRTMSYRSGKLVDGTTTNLKEYDKVRVNLEGKGFITVYIDDVAVISNAAIVEPLTIIGIPNEQNKGYSIQFEVSGCDKLHGIEYSVKGRSNA